MFVLGSLSKNLKKVALYLYKSTINTIVCKNLKQILAQNPSCFLSMFGNLQERISKAVGPSITASLEPLPRRRNAVNLSLSHSIALVDVHLN